MLTQGNPPLPEWAFPVIERLCRFQIVPMDSDQLYALYQQQPRPITSDQCLSLAQANLTPVQYGQYSTWWAINGQTVLDNLNG